MHVAFPDWRSILLTALLASGLQAVAAPTPCSAQALQASTFAPADYRRCVTALLADAAPAEQVSNDALYGAALVLSGRDFLHPATDDVASMRAVDDALDARHALRPLERRLMLQMLLSNALFDEAASYQASIPSRRDAVLPRLVALAAPTRPGEARYWAWDAATNALREQSMDLAHGAHVVVISSDCHFCNDAASALAQDASLSGVFRDRAIWIARPDSAFDVASIKAWDAAHPQAPNRFIFDLRGWPVPEVWGTPTFLFLRDGAVVKTLPGWWPARAADLRDGLKAIGLAPIG